MTVHLRFELGRIREPVRQHLPRLFERLAEVEHLLKLRASVGATLARRLGLRPDRPDANPVGTESQPTGVAAVNLPIDHLLRPPPRRGQRVLPAERLELDVQRVAEAGVEFLQHLLERRPLHRQITRRGDEDSNRANVGHAGPPEVAYAAGRVIVTVLLPFSLPVVVMT